jgi:hypothetical protein
MSKRLGTDIGNDTDKMTANVPCAARLTLIVSTIISAPTAVQKWMAKGERKMRDRLSEIIQSAVGGCAKYWADVIADKLISEGVIVPPVKVGQILYSINRKPLRSHWEESRYIIDAWDEYKICEIPFSLVLWECGWKEFGKKLFLTRKDAEKALAERRENDNN